MLVFLCEPQSGHKSAGRLSSSSVSPSKTRHRAKCCSLAAADLTRNLVASLHYLPNLLHKAARSRLALGRTSVWRQQRHPSQWKEDAVILKHRWEALHRTPINTKIPFVIHADDIIWFPTESSVNSLHLWSLLHTRGNTRINDGVRDEKSTRRTFLQSFMLVLPNTQQTTPVAMATQCTNTNNVMPVYSRQAPKQHNKNMCMERVES